LKSLDVDRPLLRAGAWTTIVIMKTPMDRRMVYRRRRRWCGSPAAGYWQLRECR